MAVPEPRNFLQPCLLLLLRERADHGYELVSRLRPMHDTESDSGGVYRALRALGRQVEMLMFDDDGHEIVRRENRERLAGAVTRWLTEAFSARRAVSNL